MSPVELIRIHSLMNRTTGSRRIVIGLIDGPIVINHPQLDRENILEISGVSSGNCSVIESIACTHGTFIAGILKAGRGGVAPALCPDCSLLVRPVFSELPDKNDSLPVTNPAELGKAIVDCVGAGARIINLSLSIESTGIRAETELHDAISYAANRHVIIVAAAANQRIIGSTAITRHPWVIPVIACDDAGRPLRLSGLSHSIGRNGLLAPGENIISLGTVEKPVMLSGTSVAVPFVTGTIALLWSLFPELSGSVIRHAISHINKGRSITPSLMDASASWEYLHLNYPQKAVA